MSKVLNVENLKVTFGKGFGKIEVVRGIDFFIDEGQTLALVGESGSGKSVTARSILKLDESSAVTISAEDLTLGGINILESSEKDMLNVRGKIAGMVFQDPMTYLNPTIKIGKQITEALFRQKIKTIKECEAEAIRLLEMVKISEPSVKVNQYPHQFSGGMRQRAMIAMALACKPKLLIADEPTTALDPTTQLQILLLLKEMQKKLGTSILIITHDLNVVSNVADKVAVMYGGKIVEQGNCAEVLKSPRHPYTVGLIESLPTLETGQSLKAIKGSPPDLKFLPKGCSFAIRCDQCMKICTLEEPSEFVLEGTRKVSCWLYHPDFPRKGE